MSVLNAFTIDVEDYFQVSAFERHIRREQWDDYQCRVVANTQRILRLLDRYQVRGTFFILGWVAQRFPQLVRQIDQAGHEIGSHSYWHQLIYELTPDQFRADLQRSRDVLQQILGQEVTAYRAPSFSITERSLWALEILVQEGFTADSSIFPVYHDRYGIPAAEHRIHDLHVASGTLREFPPSVVTWGRMNFPVSGGGYFRLYPWQLTRRGLQAINDRGRPFTFYLHPWEVDPEQPRLAAGTRWGRLRHYVNLEGTERKLQRLLQTFRFGPQRDVLSAVVQGTLPAVDLTATRQPCLVPPVAAGPAAES